MHSWFGLINQVSYAFASATDMHLFREAPKPGTSFTWTEEHDNLFKESKSVVFSKNENSVPIFDKSKPTCLATDWSKNGIGCSKSTATVTQPGRSIAPPGGK